MSTIIFFQKHSSYKAFEHLIWYNINCRKEKLPLNFPFVLLFVYVLELHSKKESQYVIHTEIFVVIHFYCKFCKFQS